MTELQTSPLLKILCGLLISMNLFLSTSSEEANPTIVPPAVDPWTLFQYGDQSKPLYINNSRKEFLKLCIYPPSKEVVKICPTTEAKRKTCISHCTTARLAGLSRAQDRVRTLVEVTKETWRSAFLWCCWCFALFVGICLWMVERFQFINLPLIGDPYLDDPTEGIKYRHFRWMKWISVARSNYNWSSHLRTDHTVVNWVSVSEVPFKRPRTPDHIRKREPRDSEHPEWNIQNMIQKAKQDRLPGHLARWFVMQDYWFKMYDWSWRRYLSEPASSVPHITRIYPRPVRYVPKRPRSTPLLGDKKLTNSASGNKKGVLSQPLLTPLPPPTRVPQKASPPSKSSSTTLASRTTSKLKAIGKAIGLAAKSKSAQTVGEVHTKEVANKAVETVDKEEPDKPVVTVEVTKSKPKTSKRKSRPSKGKRSKRKGSNKNRTDSVDKTLEDMEDADKRAEPEQEQEGPPPEPLVESAWVEGGIKPDEQKLSLDSDNETTDEVRRKSSTNEKFIAGISGTLDAAKELRNRMKSRQSKHKKKKSDKKHSGEQNVTEDFQQTLEEEVDNAQSPYADCWNETLPDGTIVKVCGEQGRSSKGGETTEEGKQGPAAS